ncbi:DUF1223 domain-containing protein [Pedobacter sp. PWIIR3]
MIKKTSLTILAAWIILVAFTLEEKSPSMKSAIENGFAVVELFTSEGCSSCPPADALIAKVGQEMKGQQVYILAYHVDYWNRLGWKDQFSSPENSKRQNHYADWLNLKTIYTPQIVVNGTTEFVGSSERELRSAINLGLHQDVINTITLGNPKLANSKVAVAYQITGDTKGLELVLANIQPKASSEVSRGENAGHTLTHVQIVNIFQLFPLNGKTTGTAETNMANNKTNPGELIAFLQETKTGKIRAASRTSIL